MSARLPVFLLIGILAVAVAVRLYGLTYGLPYFYNADEAQVVLRALGMGTGDLNPHLFEWPASPLIYITFTLFGSYYVAGSLLGIFHSVQDFAERMVADPTVLFILARGFVAITGAASVYLNYLLGRLLFRSQIVGIVAALFLAVTPFHVELSETVRPDVPMILTIQLFLLACYLLWTRGHLRYYLLAGALIGLAVAFKYSAASTPPILLAAHSTRYKPGAFFRRLAHPWIGLGAAASILMFIVATPFSVLAFPEFARDFLHMPSYIRMEQPWAVPPVPSWLHLLTDTLPRTMSTVLAVFSALGFGWALYRRTPADVILLTGLLSIYVATALGRIVFPQYGLPFTPFLTLFAARAVVELLGRLSIAPQLRYGLLGLSIAVVVTQPLLQVAQQDYTRTQKDTRTVAKEWIEANVPAGAKVLMDGGRDFFTVSPPLSYSRSALARRMEEARKDGESGKARYWETLLQVSGHGGYDLYPIQGDMPHRTVPQIRQEGFQYVILSSDIQAPVITGEAIRWDPKADTLYRSLQREAVLIRTFVPAALQPGPTLWVYRIP
ncbi:MAG: glycosyltransferase family 39 protein [Chloroflexi bacterium]|nr:glycosyltransferase family 39 protein [Chloroflexota bacterium]